ncbi:hypothetical protein IT568_11935, partial [bacterium]|nr:hypothetical protein [bacterium]
KLTAENLTETLDYFKVNEGSEKLVFFHFDALKNALPDELKGKVDFCEAGVLIEKAK